MLCDKFKWKKGSKIEYFLNHAPRTKEHNYISENNGNLKFSNKSIQWGFADKKNSNGLAYADLDNDGDLDLIVNNLDDTAAIYRNNNLKNNKYLDFRLKGYGSNSFAIGTKIKIFYGTKIQVLEHYPTRGYLSSIDYKLHFGVEQTDYIDKIEIYWPDLTFSSLFSIKSNQIIELDYKKMKRMPLKSAKKNKSLFKNITNEFKFSYKHKESKFPDFSKEILLPYKLSSQGPDLIVYDYDNDNLDDLLVLGDKYAHTQLFKQFKKQISDTSIHFSPPAAHLQHEDLGALFFDFDNDGDNDLYVCSGSNESSEGSVYYQDRLYINQNGTLIDGTSLLPQMLTSTKVVVANDFDGDGDLDLFVGGRLVPQKYPKAPRSYLLRNDGDKFVDVTETYCKDLLYPGMVTGAEFADINGDGQDDLTLVGEWMPFQTFLKKDDAFVKQQHQLQTEGLWFSLKKADIDQDGDMDFVAGNLGTNCKFKGSLKKPFNIYADDFDNNGTWDMMLSSYEGNKNYPLRGRDCSSAQMPFITDSFPSFKAFAIAEIDEICGPKFDESLHLTVRGFESSVFLNDGKGNFEMRPLPVEAQFSPTLDMHIEDLNKDGHLDLMLVGNMYNTEVETVRYDAGRGAVLMGDGKGNFESIPPHESGFFAWDNCKSIEKITVKGKELYLVGVNNGNMMVFEKTK